MNRIFVYFSFLIICLTACAPSRPSGILSQDEMEDVLYDMHIAQALYESREGRTSDADIIAIRASVLDKHGVSKADWDSSFNYYCRNANELYVIYKNISDKLDRNITALGGQVIGVQGEEADTANIWKGESSFILMQQAPFNLYSFEVMPDSTVMDGDKIQLQFDVQFIFQDGFRELTAYIASCYERSDSLLKANPQLTKDTVATCITHLSNEGHGIATITNDVDRLHLKKIKGFFLLSQNYNDVTSDHNGTTLRLVTVRNVKLLHLPTNPPAVAKPAEERPDSLRRDSLMRDSVMKRPMVVNR